MTDEYRIKLSRDPIFGLWSYKINTPDGRVLRPLFGGAATEKRTIEAQALRRIELDRSSEFISLAELEKRVREHK